MPDGYSHIVEFDEAELVCRMVEAFHLASRPPGVSAADAVSAMEPETRDGWLRVSVVVHGYWTEIMANARRLQ